MFRVMIVDDEVAIREKVSRLIDFQKYGFMVCATAKNGQEAFDLLPQIKPDLIFLDVRMPILDGLGFLRKLRKTIYSDIKIIILSGYSDFEYARKAMSLGARGYLTKPIDEDEVIQCLKEFAIELQNHQVKKTCETVQQQVNKLKAIYNGVNTAHGFEDALILHLVVLSYTEDYENKSLYDLVQECVSEKFNVLGNLLFRTMGGVYSYFVPKHMLTQKERVFCLELVNLLETKGVTCAVLLDEEVFLSSNKPFRQSFSAHLYEMLTDIFYDQNTFILYTPKGEPDTSLVFQNDADILMEFRESLLVKPKKDVIILLEKIIEQLVHFRLDLESIQALNYRIYYIILEAVKSATNSKDPNMKQMEWREVPVFITIERWKSLQIQQLMQAYEFIEQGQKMSKMGVGGDLLDYVSKNFQEQISIKQVAEKFFMNSAYLGRVFQKATGVSFNQYVNKLRLQEAKRLLKQTDKLVYEIAQQVGFSESKYFVEKFTKEIGYSPSEYRKVNL